MARGGPRILFAGGGTGGHVFPGIALAQHLSASPKSQVLSPQSGSPPSDPPGGDGGPTHLGLGTSDCGLFWLCTSRAFDAAQLSKEGIPFEAIESPRWRGFRGFLGPMARAILRSAQLIRDFRPDVLFGVGGYGTVPPVIAARALGVPYVLLEPNVRPGRANRFLAPGAARIYVQWPATRNAFPGCGEKVRVTGSPLRRQLRPVPREPALARFGLGSDLPTLAVVGGSQGAEVLNRSVIQGLDGAASRLQIIHIAGKGQVDGVRAAYSAKGARAAVCDFVPDMDALYSAADLVVSRAGAMAIAELAAFGVPAVLVPIARSSGDHQRENARAMARAGGAILLEERDCAAGLAPILRRLVLRDPVFDNMRRCLRPLARPDAARAILDDLGEFLER